MKRPWQIWLAYALCAAGVFAALCVLTVRALDLDRAEVSSRHQAVLEENARLGLWRLDSALAPLVAQENARPYFLYSAFYPMGGDAAAASGKSSGGKTSTSKLTADASADASLKPSPLLLQTPALVKLHFQIDAAGDWSSPQIPAAAQRERAWLANANPEAVAAAEASLRTVRQQIQPREVFGLLPAEPPQLANDPQNSLAMNSSGAIFGEQQPSIVNSIGNNSYSGNSTLGNKNVDNQFPAINPANPQIDNSQGGAPNVSDSANQAANLTPQQGSQIEQQQARNVNEFNRRNAYTVGQSLSQQFANGTLNVQTPAGVRTATMQARWIGDQLYLLRRVTIGGRELLQGCLIDWPALRQQGRDVIADLLPTADLAPLQPQAQLGNSRLLASLPVILLPGELPFDDANTWSPMRISLLAAWVCVSLAALAFAGLLQGVMTLSGRRATFVSAVTHELRTPLTTFRMYAEMLADDMLPSEAARKSYLETLRTEADRLTHLVENVLAYARLERGRPSGRVHEMPVEQIVQRMESRLTDRARQAAFELTVEVAAAASDAAALADVTAVDQILFNLVDNACKYAATATDRRIHLAIDCQPRRVTFSVRDHGPGIAPRERRRLFQAFRKSATEAAQSAPGIGLGLSLSRRLAKDMNGSLQYRNANGGGAEFVLSLPIVKRADVTISAI